MTRTFTHVTRRTFALLGAAGIVLGVSACGSDAPSQAATATKGDAFCAAASAADTVGNAVDFSSTADELKVTMQAAVDAAKAAQKVAPKDIQDTVDAAVKLQDQILALFSKYDFDIAKVQESEDGQAFFADTSQKAVGDELDQYNFDKCGVPLG
jgi:hypothetical protein